MSDPDGAARPPCDPQRLPWGSGGATLRPGYRVELRELDGRLVALGERVCGLAAPVGDVGVVLTDPLVAATRAEQAQVRTDAARLEDAAFTLVALQSPMAGDLREVVAIIRGAYEIMRTSRLVVHVLEALQVLQDAGRLAGDDDLARLRRQAPAMFRAAVTAWATRDALAHNELRRRDDEVDRLRDGILGRQQHGNSDEVVALTQATRLLERIADHGLELTAYLSWAVTGDRVGAAPGSPR